MEIAGFVTIILLAAAVSALITLCLKFSCNWCRHRMLEYNEFLRQHEARTQYLSTPTPNSNQNTAWVYTIEQGYRTNLISYSETGQNPPINDANKRPFDGLPTYEEVMRNGSTNTESGVPADGTRAAIAVTTI